MSGRAQQGGGGGRARESGLEAQRVSNDPPPWRPSQHAGGIRAQHKGNIPTVSPRAIAFSSPSSSRPLGLSGAHLGAGVGGVRGAVRRVDLAHDQDVGRAADGVADHSDGPSSEQWEAGAGMGKRSGNGDVDHADGAVWGDCTPSQPCTVSLSLCLTTEDAIRVLPPPSLAPPSPASLRVTPSLLT